MMRSASLPRAANSASKPERTAVSAALPAAMSCDSLSALSGSRPSRVSSGSRKRLSPVPRARAMAPGQHEGQGPGRAAGSQDRDLLAVELDAGLAEVQHGARGVGGGPHQPIPFPVEGVDASGETGLFTQTVEMLDDRLLVRDGHVGAEETHAAEAGDDLALGPRADTGRARSTRSSPPPGWRRYASPATWNAPPAIPGLPAVWCCRRS